MGGESTNRSRVAREGVAGERVAWERPALGDGERLFRRESDVIGAASLEIGTRTTEVTDHGTASASEKMESTDVAEPTPQGVFRTLGRWYGTRETERVGCGRS